MLELGKAVFGGEFTTEKGGVIKEYDPCSCLGCAPGCGDAALVATYDNQVDLIDDWDGTGWGRDIAFAGVEGGAEYDGGSDYGYCREPHLRSFP